MFSHKKMILNRESVEFAFLASPFWGGLERALYFLIK
jgi:hypothetical protein